MDYGSAISKVLPGTFVPDIGAATRLDESPNVGPIPGGAANVAGIGETQGPSFKDTVKSMLADVNDKINISDQGQRDLATGKTNDLQKVVTSVEEANLALNFTMAMRSKLLEAYQEVSRMQL
ncbi:MAG: flagellar hook-basal body complex protein FliE [Candidatus Eremiobacteraeota bacterium]|jgi:flagellar hook-basal body complex protein FliE|nr:flagellar hook-basal body complex protein FliE [Candidatus Eremiobacteraeota bacterium]